MKILTKIKSWFQEPNYNEVIDELKQNRKAIKSYIEEMNRTESSIKFNIQDMIDSKQKITFISDEIQKIKLKQDNIMNVLEVNDRMLRDIMSEVKK